jgi:2-oxoglutarate ferredoxin oxidoreductase subunit delta
MAKVKLTIDSEKCKGCELCVNFCPKKILALGKETNTKGYFPVTVINEDECIACGTCAIMCPDSIITVEKE